MAAEGSLTDAQEITLSLLYIFSSLLSILGSSTIAYKVISDRAHAVSYDRLMLGLSISDILASTGWLLTPFLLPKDTSSRVWAIGNDASCTFLGFLTQLGFAAVIYNMFLSFYYLLTVRFGVKRQAFAVSYEMWFHVFAIVFAVGTATVGASIGAFSEVEVGMGCWVNNWPEGCYDDCLTEELGWLFAAGPIVFTFLALIINNVLVYRRVSSVFKASTGVESERSLRQRMQKKEVAQQGLFYVACFAFCYWAAAVARGLEAYSDSVEEEESLEGGIYWILVIQAFTLPLQGFLNMFVYNRPNFSRVRAAYPELSFFSAVRMACLDPQIPKLQEITSRSASIQRSYNKYHKKSSSGAAFQSDLHQIEEESDEDKSSSDGSDGRFVARVGSMVASRGDTRKAIDMDDTEKSPEAIDGPRPDNVNIGRAVDSNMVPAQNLHVAASSWGRYNRGEEHRKNSPAMPMSRRIAMDGATHESSVSLQDPNDR